LSIRARVAKRVIPIFWADRGVSCSDGPPKHAPCEALWVLEREDIGRSRAGWAIASKF
jgi:hypothetical protein